MSSARNLIIVCGSRVYDNYDKFCSSLERFLSKYDSADIISGGARGVDTMAIRYANLHNIPLHVFNANWNVYGKSAGYIRNAEMLEFARNNGNPIVLAFWDGKSKGTAHMIKIATKKNVPVKTVIINEENSDD